MASFCLPNRAMGKEWWKHSFFCLIIRFFGINNSDFQICNKLAEEIFTNILTKNSKKAIISHRQSLYTAIKTYKTQHKRPMWKTYKFAKQTIFWREVNDRFPTQRTCTYSKKTRWIVGLSVQKKTKYETKKKVYNWNKFANVRKAEDRERKIRERDL